MGVDRIVEPVEVPPVKVDNGFQALRAAFDEAIDAPPRMGHGLRWRHAKDAAGAGEGRLKSIFKAKDFNAIAQEV